MFFECMVWRGCEGGGYIEDDESITPRAPPEEERIKRNLSEGEKVLSFQWRPKASQRKVFFFFFFFSQIEADQECVLASVNQNLNLPCMIITHELCFANGYRVLS